MSVLLRTQTSDKFPFENYIPGKGIHSSHSKLRLFIFVLWVSILSSWLSFQWREHNVNDKTYKSLQHSKIVFFKNASMGVHVNALLVSNADRSFPPLIFPTIMSFLNNVFIGCLLNVTSIPTSKLLWQGRKLWENEINDSHKYLRV